MILSNNSSSSSGSKNVLEKFRELLRRKAGRVTGNREALLKALLKQKGHFELEELIEDLQKSGVEASRATVYRNLPLLREAGIMQPVLISGEKKLYEVVANKEHHDHLICQRCGKVVEFHYEAIEVLQQEVARQHNFVITGHLHELFGTCENCSNRESSVH